MIVYSMLFLQFLKTHFFFLFQQNWEATQQFVYRTSLKFRHLSRDTRLTSDNQGFNKEQLEEKIKKKLTELLQVPSEAIDMNQPMTNYGVDSMMSMELTTWASRELGLGITQLEVLGGLTVESLAKKGTLGLR